ncbi:hypothetical protein F5I97DRAFT_485807 [Phlebopus sp. FC_14]|nr:hypothetical protein F5I97DRAFT_485807 [Phlebopus sp. FC_14]
MNRPLCNRTLARLRRSLHVSGPSRHLVGPNDPVSNLRPIIYTDLPTSLAPHPTTGSAKEPTIYHPYSLGEFAHTNVAQDHALELRFKLARERLDALNHHYWAESNTRFEEAKSAVLASLPASASPETREDALSGFYRDWVVQERARQDAYSEEMRRRSWEVVVLEARVGYERLKSRIWG